jgi:ATP-dependent DNA helicase RecG
MAPTEILAEQLHLKFHEWLAPLGFRVAWLAAALKGKAKRQTLADIAAGDVDVAVGTHALFQAGVEFRRLTLAVVDEQHRFGVGQRLALREKGNPPSPTAPLPAGEGRTPHLLMMSATPIPRSLAMSYYADLDVSVIDELPPGRAPITTKVLSLARRDEVVGRLRDYCLSGAQAYWVCPLVEESEKLQLKAAEESHAELTAALPELAIGLVHGRMKAEEKAAVMAAFKAGGLNLLVATTVIEVGVDVPNAALMVIEHAERYGLAQLHQLRGRVGRGQRRVRLPAALRRPALRDGQAAPEDHQGKQPTASPSPGRTCTCAGPASSWEPARAACPCCASPTWKPTWTCWKPPGAWRKT